MSLSFTGVGITELRAARQSDPIYGYTYVRRFRCTTTKADELYSEAVLAGLRISIEPGDGEYDTVSVYYANTDGTSTPNETELSNRWELDGNDVEKSLWEHPSVQEIYDRLILVDPGLRRLAWKEMKDGVEAFVRGDEKYVSYTQTSFPVGTIVQVERDMDLDAIIRAVTTFTGLQSDYNRLYELATAMMCGYTTFMQSQYVLTNNVLTGPNYSLKPSVDNVGKYYTTEQLQAARSIPSSIRFALPPGYWFVRTLRVIPETSTKWTHTYQYYHQEKVTPFDQSAT